MVRKAEPESVIWAYLPNTLGRVCSYSQVSPRTALPKHQVCPLTIKSLLCFPLFIHLLILSSQNLLLSLQHYRPLSDSHCFLLPQISFICLNTSSNEFCIVYKHGRYVVGEKSGGFDCQVT